MSQARGRAPSKRQECRKTGAEADSKPSTERTMKHSLSKTFNRPLVRSAGLLGIIAIVATTVAWSGSPGGRVQLGGAWVGQIDTGVRVVVTYGATDPSGLKSVYRGQVIFPPAMLAAMGVDTVTDLVADEVVTGKNTSESTGIGYGLSGGNIALILVDRSWFTHVSPTEKHNTHETSVYLASADADNDGFPDAGAQPFVVLPAHSVSKRITR